MDAVKVIKKHGRPGGLPVVTAYVDEPLLPAIEAGDAGKAVVVNEEETGYELEELNGGGQFVIHLEESYPDPDDPTLCIVKTRETVDEIMARDFNIPVAVVYAVEDEAAYFLPVYIASSLMYIFGGDMGEFDFTTTTLTQLTPTSFPDNKIYYHIPLGGSD